jgi:hypothetical protein
MTAVELQDLVQQKVGTTKFATTYNRIRQSVLGVQRERRIARVTKVKDKVYYVTWHLTLNFSSLLSIRRQQQSANSNVPSGRRKVESGKTWGSRRCLVSKLTHCLTSLP